MGKDKHENTHYYCVTYYYWNKHGTLEVDQRWHIGIDACIHHAKKKNFHSIKIHDASGELVYSENSSGTGSSYA